MQFGLGDCNVTLKPRLGYVPKSLSTPFRVQVVALSAFTPELATSSDATPNQVLCLVRALRVYVDRTAQFRQSEQLFVCFGGSTKGQPVFKQRLSNWLVKAIALAYLSQGMQCPIGVRAHLTRAVASSWAWTKGSSIKDISMVAGWFSQNNFARFYNLDVWSLASQVLSVSTTHDSTGNR